jgi:hypothetical protein
MRHRPTALAFLIALTLVACGQSSTREMGIDQQPAAEQPGTNPPVILEPGERPVMQPAPVTKVGSLNTPRSQHEALLLADGRVLVIGGRDRDAQAVARLEFFDPAERAFSEGPLIDESFPADSLLSNPEVLLADGHVLLTNGQQAWLLDPATGAVTVTGSLKESRVAHTATLLADGRVLLAGGANQGTAGQGYAPTASAEIYDPESGTFTLTGPLLTARNGHQAAGLSDGRVLVVGGTAGAASAEVYDPASGQFTAVTGLKNNRAGGVLTALPDGSAIVTGGINLFPPEDQASPAVATAERFDPATGKFASIEPMRRARANHRVVVLEDGRALLVGGASCSACAAATLVAATEYYDPTTKSFAAGPVLPDPQTLHSATTLADGSVLVAGGAGAVGKNSDVTGSAWILRP